MLDDNQDTSSQTSSDNVYNPCTGNDPLFDY